MLWQGIDVDVWGPIQTLSPKVNNTDWLFFTGYDTLKFDWAGIVRGIPLDIRYASFKERLARRIVTPTTSGTD